MNTFALWYGRDLQRVADIQKQALEANVALQRRMFDETRANYGGPREMSEAEMAAVREQRKAAEARARDARHREALARCYRNDARSAAARGRRLMRLVRVAAWFGRWIPLAEMVADLLAFDLLDVVDEVDQLLAAAEAE